MTAVRRDVVTSRGDREAFVEAALRLSREDTGLTTPEVNDILAARLPGFRIFGLDQSLTTWDLFVLWHHLAMTLPTRPARPLRNLAHGGPVFLPWHRMFLLRLEQQVQRVLGDPDAGLPYWDWATDGDADPAEQSSAPLWQDGWLGTSQGQVVNGPLAELRVRLVGFGAQLWSVEPRPLARAAGRDTDRLPTHQDVAWALGNGADGELDRSPWDATTDSVRNRLEGWLVPEGAGGPQLHNRVHVWVGADMTSSSSPNDPVFYLNHANVDRLWEAWMSTHGRAYRPVQEDADGPEGHRVDDPMMAVLGAPLRPSDVLDPEPWYRYDDLAT